MVVFLAPTGTSFAAIFDNVNAVLLLLLLDGDVLLSRLRCFLLQLQLLLKQLFGFFREALILGQVVIYADECLDLSFKALATLLLATGAFAAATDASSLASTVLIFHIVLVESMILIIFPTRLEHAFVLVDSRLQVIVV